MLKQGFTKTARTTASVSAPAFRRTTGQLAAPSTQIVRPTPQTLPTTPVGLGIQKIRFNPKLSMTSRVKF